MYEYYEKLLDNTKDILKASLDEETFIETFEDVKKVVDFKNNTIYILAPDRFTQTKINKAYIRDMQNILNELDKNNYRFKVVVEEEQEEIKMNNKNRLNVNNLIENYNFETFVIGEHNRFPAVSALRVAENPGYFANPFYIFGGVGLGKTHLMQAIGNYILDNDYEQKVLFIQAEEFIVDYTKATNGNKTMNEFEKKYNDLDVLLIDDIQMLGVGKKSQQEFFKIFNNLYNNKKQIVITSDCPADELKDIMERLTSRFQQGMIVNITKPNLDERMEILKRKAEEQTKKIVPREVLQYIANAFINNVRELEGALNVVINYSDMLNKEITLQTAEEALKSLTNRNMNLTKEDKIYDDLIDVIVDYYQITLNDLIGTKRNAKYVLPRHIAMYLLKKLYDLPYKKIGKLLGDRDHSTIMNGCEKIENDLKTNKELNDVIVVLSKKVGK